MDTEAVVVLDAGVEVEEVAASAACCGSGPKAVITDPAPQG